MGLTRKRALLLAFATSASFMASQPAQAAENLQCVESIRTEAVDGMIFAAYRARTLDDALRAGVGGQFTLCAEQNQWSQGARDSAAVVLLQGIVEAGVKKEFAVQKFAADRLAGWLAAYVIEIPADELEVLVSGDLLEHHMQVAIEKLIVNGIITQRQVTVRTSALIGEYLTARANLRFHRARFEAE